MCNLYRMTSATAEIARLFGGTVDAGANVGAEVYPGYPGLVMADGRVRSMIWGFPLTLKGKSGQPLKPKAVNNARTDKLTSGFWRSSFEHRRCLIPLSAFAEAEGPPGAKTRTWFSLPGASLFACAGIWRESAEWGAVYSMVMTDGSPAIELIHDRMPVILTGEMQHQWTTGTPEEALELCVPYAGNLAVDATNQPWNAFKPPRNA
ncbi:SOS response-associated peptidase [Sphingomonas sp. IC081]|uniref:SOS response-associated peptidase n=1 Tax=Sphingomonas sp. IC081 TaxID=304378 RepID=UPI001158BB04|nr:SOS response-associated peptidase family protein [Sphingomonas sp. IC081]QDK32583.1 hypothetical protein DM450_07260 [Sphingomonas sp. IC081]